jgi:hypothetical protein
MAPTIYFQEERLYVSGITLRLKNLGAGEMSVLAKKARDEAKKASIADSIWENEHDLLNRTPQHKMHSLEIAIKSNCALLQYAIDLDCKKKEYDERLLITGPYKKVYTLSKVIDDNFKQAGFQLIAYEFRHIPVINRFLNDTDYRESLAILLR